MFHLHLWRTWSDSIPFPPLSLPQPCGLLTFILEFSSQLKGYEGVVCQCHNCGNYSGRVVKRNPWFTFCFVPVIPLSIHGYTDIVCSICNFAQPLENRPDVRQQMNGQGGMPLQNQQPPGQPPQGWGGGPPGGGQPKPPQQNMQYG